jgi:hypothetical protein
MKKWLINFVILFIFSWACLPAFAEPPWRGTQGATFQRWSFGDSSTSPSPDAGYVNPFGTPSLFIGDRAVWFATIDTYTGVWTPGTDEMDLQIPNTPTTGAGTQKTIWIEITWKAAGLVARVPDSLTVNVDPESDYTAINFTHSDTSIGNGWFRTVEIVDIWPNPTSEWITVKGDIYIDEITIDTKCIPEPATLLLIALGGLALRRKK